MPATLFLLFLSTATPVLIIVPDNSALEEYIQLNWSVIADRPHLESKDHVFVYKLVFVCKLHPFWSYPPTYPSSPKATH